MDKKTRGLPPSFQLNVARGAVNSPVQLGDYLDEEDSPSTVVTAFPPRESTSDSVEKKDSEYVKEPTSSREPPVTQIQFRSRAPVPKPTRLPVTVPRKQVNMTPETLRMVDEILNYVQTYSVQKDTKASELFHALVLALYEARDYLDLSRVQPRGRWGTPTAAAFPIAIKNAIQTAIAARHYREKG